MFRYAISVLRFIRPPRIPVCNAARIIGNDFRNYAIGNIQPNFSVTPLVLKEPLITNKKLLEIAYSHNTFPARSVTKLSLKRGKRKTVKAVVKRFLRLQWGGWIRTKCGRAKKMWKKTSQQKRRLRQHVFCNATQSTLLDKMVTKFWKRPKYYVDDVYAPYHTREEFSITRKHPKHY